MTTTDRKTDRQKTSHCPTALTIAGSDCSGGAGIQADIKTMSALGVYAASAITAITIQNTTGVKGVAAVAPDVVEKQIRAVMEDICPKAVKTGMVNDASTIGAIVRALDDYHLQHLVVDPVMVSTSGCALMNKEAIHVFKRLLMPKATLLTPNIPEAEVLSGISITDDRSLLQAGTAIAQLTGGHVLVKGGHAKGRTKTDRLFDARGLVTEISHRTVSTNNTHGTGCTLSAAITAWLALGKDLQEAVALGKAYMTQALAAGSDVASWHGKGPVNHFFNPQPLVKWKTNIS